MYTYPVQYNHHLPYKYKQLVALSRDTTDLVYLQVLLYVSSTRQVTSVHWKILNSALNGMLIRKQIGK